jgi:hypothetical protein
MESSNILSTAMDIIRKSEAIRSTKKNVHKSVAKEKRKDQDDEFVIIEKSPPNPSCSKEEPKEEEVKDDMMASSIADLAIQYSNFAEKYPHLFRMCIDCPSSEHAENLIRILPMMLRQRDGIMKGATQMESATAKIVESLNKTYIDPLNIPRKDKTNVC